MRDKVILLTNIPTPYRTPLYNAMFELAGESGLRFEVLYCREREPNRTWYVDFTRHRAPFTVLPGLLLSLKKREFFFHFNPAAVPRLLDRKLRDLILAGSWNSPTSLLALAAVKLFNRRAKIALWSESHGGSVRHSRGPVARLRRLCYRLADAFIVPNEASRALAASLRTSPAEVFFVHNTIDESVFDRPVAKGAARAALGLPAEKRIIVTVARLEERKGIGPLLDCVAAASRLLPQAYFVLVGEGDLAGRARALQTEDGGECFRYVPRLAPEDLREYLGAADAFLLPSLSDPNPLSAIEAAFAGVYLILSRFAGNACDLVDGQFGSILKTVDANTIEAAVSGFLKLPDVVLARLAAGLKRHVRNTFSVSANRRELKRFFFNDNPRHPLTLAPGSEDGAKERSTLKPMAAP